MNKKEKINKAGRSKIKERKRDAPVDDVDNGEEGKVREEQEGDLALCIAWATARVIVHSVKSWTHQIRDRQIRNTA